MFHVTDFAPRAAVLDKENASTFVLPNLKGVFLVFFFAVFRIWHSTDSNCYTNSCNLQIIHTDYKYKSDYKYRLS